MGTEQKTTGLTYQELCEMFPEEDNVRRELIDGELIVTPSPSIRHQRVVVWLCIELGLYARRNGGEVFVAPLDVFFSDTNVVEPDVLFVRPENLAKVEKRFVRSAPDLVVEVSSPSTRRLELVRKLELYERFGVPEYWYVDLEADRVEVYQLTDERYGTPRLLGRDAVLESSEIVGFSIAAGALLGPPEE